MFSFIETKLFTRLAQEYLTDDEYVELQWYLAGSPESGPVIPGTGGVRNLRWRASGRGKRGGYRVIYYFKRADGVIWMLTMYPKNVLENIPANVLRQIREEIEKCLEENATLAAKFWRDCVRSRAGATAVY